MLWMPYTAWNSARDLKQGIEDVPNLSNPSRVDHPIAIALSGQVRGRQYRGMAPRNCLLYITDRISR